MSKIELPRGNQQFSIFKNQSKYVFCTENLSIIAELFSNKNKRNM